MYAFGGRLRVATLGNRKQGNLLLGISLPNFSKVFYSDLSAKVKLFLIRGVAE